MKVIIAIILFLALPGLAMAADPAGQLAYSSAQTSTLPYEFAPIPIPTSQYQLIPDFTEVTFVNQMGSSALTVFSILDGLMVLGIFVVLLLAARALWWLYHFVTDTRPNPDNIINVSGGFDAAADVSGEEGYRQAGRATRKIVGFGKNPYR